MKVQENIGKISWSMADKLLYILYGFVMLFQIKALVPEEFGVYYQFNNLHIWIFIVSDSFALQSIIQFGAVRENRPKVNLLALFLHAGITLGAAALLFLFKEGIGDLINQPRFDEIALYLPLLAMLFIPRTYCIKFIYREHKMHFLFFVNFAWLGTMTALTVWMLLTKSMLLFEDMVFISYSGAFVSSIAAVVLTFKYLEFSFKGDLSLKKVSSFGLPLMLYNSLQSMPKLLDVYVLGYFFSSSAVGIYSSAKVLFRFFEEALNGAHGLVYPAAVRKVTQENYKELNDLMTKAVSFMVVSFGIIIIMLEIGLSDFIVRTFLSEKYVPAIDRFNLLALAGVVLPLSVLSSVIVAAGKPGTVLKIVLISIAASGVVFFVSGLSGAESATPLGYMTYIFVSSLLYFVYVNRNFGFKKRDLFRAFGDSKHYLKKFLKRVK